MSLKIFQFDAIQMLKTHKFVAKFNSMKSVLSRVLTWRFLLRSILLLIVLTGFSLWFCNWKVERFAEGKIYYRVDEIPHRKVGLLLGTSKMLANNYENLYFRYRIEAAVALYKAGKIDFILISGDNGNDNYNEPVDMQNALIEAGVPESRIYLDYAGFRTFDSVFRANYIFGQKSFTIISQPFHNERAIYIAQHLGLDAIGFNAQDVNAKFGFKTLLRERFARVNMFLDFLISTEPKFYGESIEISKNKPQVKAEEKE